MTRHRLAVVALAALVAAGTTGLAACGSSEQDTTASSTTTSTVEVSVPTLPPEAMDGITDDTIGEPSPPLPGNIVPEAFEVGALAALGNVQMMVTGVDQPGSDPANPQRMTIRLDVTNGSLDDLELSASSFLLYFDDGSSIVLNPQDASGLFDGAFESAETIAGELSFTVPEGRRPILLLFDSAGYGDKVFSGGFVVGI